MRLEKSNIEATTAVREQETKVSKKSKKEKEVIVPIIEEKKENTVQSPIEGYYIEKTTPDTKNDVDPDDNDDDDDTIDTNVHPEERLKLAPSIALNQVSNQLTNALDQAVDRASNTGIESDDPTDRFFTQAQDLAENDDPNAIFKIDFGKRFNIYGKGIYQYTNHTYNDTETKIHMIQNSERLELGGTYSSKSGNTKGVFLGSATISHTNVNDTTPEYTSEEIAPENLNTIDENTEIFIPNQNIKLNAGVYNAFTAVQHTFKNKDIITANAFFNYDGVQESNTTEFNADYYLNKYKAHISGGASIYNGPDNVHTVKTNFNCTFNPESEEVSDITNSSTENISDNSADNNTDNNTNNTDTTTTPSSTPIQKNKKWKTKFSPFLDTQTIEGFPEEGLGVQVRLKKIEKDSATRLYGFGKFSTTQRGDESSLYHITTGVGAKYTQSVGRNGALQAKADIKDKVTFGNGNILTTTGSIKYINPKVSAELEGMFISVPKSTYAGVVGRVSYTPKKNIHTYAEASYLNWVYPEGKINGTSLTVGALISF